MDSVPEFAIIEDPIAEDVWSYNDGGGAERKSLVRIGRPRPWPGDPNGDWFCPFEVEHFTDGVRTAVGVGPVDALMNAVSIVRAFADGLGGFSPRAR